jgi:(E)-4-hydroxy-3-methylbut-2-enyl-diphosphate synthase
MTRENTRKIMVGNVQIGSQNKLVIQSMTNTKTHDIEKTVEQIIQLEAAGCEIVRVAVLEEKDAVAIKKLKERINIPIVADIHFNYRFALSAIDNGVDKIRINPGNLNNLDEVKAVVEACKKKSIPIRIGINSGSLPEGTPVTGQGMVDAAMHHVKILEDMDFYDICISLKASNPMLAIESYEIASKTFDYPLHLGITEAGTKFIGAIKSSAALGVLINQGIGDTIRISLSDDPAEEIKVAKELLNTFGLYSKPTLVSCPTCGRIQYDMIPLAQEMETYLETIEKPVTVAIMGCPVNGPGEAKHSDIAICGGKDGGLLMIDGEIIEKIDEDQIVDRLKEEIDKYKK